MTKERDLSEYNRTELFLKAQEQNPNVRHNTSREQLIAIATGELQVDLPPRPVDKTRLVIMEFINAHWDQVKAIIACPARSQDPRACFSCTDIQIAECALKNRDIIYRSSSK
jgi:hypothetical protein